MKLSTLILPLLLTLPALASASNLSLPTQAELQSMTDEDYANTRDQIERQLADEDKRNPDKQRKDGKGRSRDDANKDGSRSRYGQGYGSRQDGGRSGGRQRRGR